MFRAPIWRQSATAATASTSPGASTSVTTGSPLTARASARISRPSPPMPRNVYGELRGLKAPPLGAGQRHRRDAELLDALDDRIDLILRRIALHDDEH